jgi:cardiolipin synthase
MFNYFSIITPLVNIIFVCFVIFAQRRNPAATWAWLMVIALFPIGGFVIYMLLGQDSRKHRVFLKKINEDESFIQSFSLINNANESKACLPFLHINTGNGPVTKNNQIKLFLSGRDKYDALIRDIETAEDFIFIQVYILRGDEIGTHLVRQLTKRVCDGLEVKLLIDGMGCIFTSKKIFKPFIEAGGKVGVFMPPVPVRLNFRNHRKLAVIDGRVGYIGGLNIGEEYLGMSKRFGPWRDTHARITGEAVHSLTLRFFMDWNFADKERLTYNEKYFPALNLQGSVRMQIVSSGPDKRYASVLYGFCKMVSEAKKNIYIQSPYFVPDESLFGALHVAALSGVDVRIMFPANPDHPFVYWAGLSYLGDLMDAGVKVYEYTKGFIHSKTIMADGAICSVGSANVDVRSFRLNFETTAFIYDETVTREMETVFERDMADCFPITPESYARRGKITKIKESVSRLFAPLL